MGVSFKNSKSQTPPHKNLGLLEVCQRLGVGRSTLFRYIAAGRFPNASGVEGRHSRNTWKSSDVEAWIANNPGYRYQWINRKVAA